MADPVAVRDQRATGTRPWEVVEGVLLELALQRGNAQATGRRLRQLHDDGAITWRPPIDETIRTWKQRYSEEYHTFCQRESEKIRQQVAEESVALARRYAEAEGEALEMLRENLEKIAPRDMANVVRNLATSKGIAVDKYEKIAAPEVIPQNAPAQLEALLKGLADKFEGLIPKQLDEPVVDAEIVAEVVDDVA